MSKVAEKEMSFWDHLDELRFLIFRTGAVWVVLSIVFFCFKDILFGKIILAPTKPDFFVYQRLGMDVNLSLINTDVTAQFMTHIKISFIVAFIVAVPYLIYEIWRFIKPALYEKERKATRGAFLFASVLFYLGMLVGYVMVLPLMVNFFAKYQVTEDVINMFNLSSYISLFSSTVLIFGLVFEFPSVIAVLSRLGIIYRKQMLKAWRYAILTVVVLAAAITPTGDPFSLAVVSLPLFILYGFSIFVCKSEPSDSDDSSADDSESAGADNSSADDSESTGADNSSADDSESTGADDSDKSSVVDDEDVVDRVDGAANYVHEADISDDGDDSDLDDSDLDDSDLYDAGA